MLPRSYLLKHEVLARALDDVLSYDLSTESQHFGAETKSTYMNLLRTAHTKRRFYCNFEL